MRTIMAGTDPTYNIGCLPNEKFVAGFYLLLSDVKGAEI